MGRLFRLSHAVHKEEKFMVVKKRRVLSISAVACLLACFFSGYAQGEELEPSALSTKAWVALKAGDYKEVSVLTDQCFKEFSEEAEKQQSENGEQITQDNASSFPELNSVGTCLFILGQSLAEQGEKEKSAAVFTKLIKITRTVIVKINRAIIGSQRKWQTESLPNPWEKETK